MLHTFRSGHRFCTAPCALTEVYVALMDQSFASGKMLWAGMRSSELAIEVKADQSSDL